MRQLPFLLFVLFICACSHQSGNSDFLSYDNKTLETEAGFDEDQLKDRSQPGKSSGKLTQNQPINQPPAEPKKDVRKMIKIADVRMEVEDFAKTREALNGIIQQYDASITKENESRTNYRLENLMVIRVLPESFDALIDNLEGLALNLNEKNINAKDVTEEFIDLESRLSTKRQVEARYRDILKQARTIPDILAVEEQLRKVVEEIESVEGRLKYLSDQVGFSTVNLTYYQVLEVASTRKRSFWKRVSRNFANGWEGLQDFTLNLVSIWPFLLIMGVFIWLIRRWWKRRR